MTQKIDSTDIEVVVVGAGPAGGSCARELAKLGRKVLLIERANEVGEPNFSSAGTPKSTVDDFKLPPECIASTWRKFVFAGPKEEARFEFPETKGYVLDFRKLKKFLVHDAITHGAEVMVATTATDFKKDSDEKFVEVSYSGAFGMGGVKTRVVVDASGPAGTLAVKAGLRTAQICKPSIGIEILADDATSEWKETLSFYVGKSVVPEGYGWIFPMGEQQVKVGVYIVDSDKEHNLRDVLSGFISRFPSLRSIEPTEFHGGSIYMNGGIKNHVADNFIAIGDAAAQLHPLGGEGIRHALWSGKFAAETIHNALNKNDTGKNELKSYEKQWKVYTGRKWKIGNVMKKLFYHTNTDADFDAIVRASKSLSPEDAFAIDFEYDYKRLFKLQYMTEMAKNKVKNFFGGLA